MSSSLRWIALLFSNGLIVVLFVALVLAVMRVDSPLPLQQGDVTVAVAESHLRVCPATNCNSIAILESGAELIVLGAREGELVEGSVVWMEVLAVEGRGFVHLSLVQAPGAQRSDMFGFVAGLMVLSFIAILLNATMFARSRLVRGVMNHPLSNPALFIAVLVSGLACAVVALFLARSEGVEVDEFASDALLNLGAGFVGAAITYVLFQVLVSHRSSATDREIVKMRESVDRLPERIGLISRPPRNGDVGENDGSDENNSDERGRDSAGDDSGADGSGSRANANDGANEGGPSEGDDPGGSVTPPDRTTRAAE
jgi:hypothetical protein